MRVRERVPCRNTAGVLVVHLVRPLRGQISGVLWTQEMNVGVLEPFGVLTHVSDFRTYHVVPSSTRHHNVLETVKWVDMMPAAPDKLSTSPE